jgi:CheY-like chemotaxis protein
VLQFAGSRIGARIKSAFDTFARDLVLEHRTAALSADASNEPSSSGSSGPHDAAPTNGQAVLAQPVDRGDSRDSRGGSKRLISIIDDHDIVRGAMKDLIESLGYRAATFADAAAYLQSDLFHDTACVITDVQMPGMSGLDLQAHLNAVGNRTPIIFLTGHPDEATRARALRSGAVGFFSKPCDEARLIASLETALAATPPRAEE